MVSRFVPDGANGYTPILNWAVHGDHCFFFAGKNANNAAAQSEVRETREKVRSGDMSIQDYHEECNFHYPELPFPPESHKTYDFLRALRLFYMECLFEALNRFLRHVCDKMFSNTMHHIHKK